jgi:hypothetical protein
MWYNYVTTLAAVRNTITREDLLQTEGVYFSSYLHGKVYQFGEELTHFGK